ncbi:23S rRNA (pseudouridine(1915)-N(3))-methyltransferase RlmH [Sinomicrobium soli]|uniref:23S rRNA (pseudouridine(1915)-N(3))-methyltransferase RlmH n=1 Tax=Sinomicrobium sp. N-1-3-6 TaxID=2219864 RepID=UPI000DCE282E|nr:23S rRNA (pseudouridine(1915)-N(3))-methyltransferase RlmH [Sinomicrobium sp. N-1-3-6]RAV27898.1 23S rRNA (pseudouridine(1915)-N(3))-methyltransferase RlmH [Sinomicrobium sp. N-1-3-6]
MNIRLLAIGKTDSKTLQSLVQEYEKRLGHYVRYSAEIIPDIKNSARMSEAQQKAREGDLLLKKLQPGDVLILLDEKGKAYHSVGFSEFLQKKMNAGTRQLVFAIGGPYGFSDAVYAQAGGKVSLSPMTFSHQMVRLFFTEQLYRAFTILNNEPYHHR